MNRIIYSLAVFLFFSPLFSSCTISTESAGVTYTNPVLVETIYFNNEKTAEHEAHQFSGVLGIGDPTVILYKDTYYLYPTGDNRGYDVYTSADLITWKKGPRVFRTRERGAWAPDVYYDDISNTFYLYYTVNRRIGIASSKKPDTAFTDHGTLIEGAIDAHMFYDGNGKYYLYYATFPGFHIYVQPMKSLTEKKGQPVKLLYPAEKWEQRHTPLTEAPWMIKQKGIYYLLYSASGANTMDYAIGYATADNPLGPFTKYPGNPIMKKGGGVYGPGHASVTRDLDGQLWMVYHQQQSTKAGWNRIICIDPIWFDERGVLHGRATRGTPQPSPVTGVRLSEGTR